MLLAASRRERDVVGLMALAAAHDDGDGGGGDGAVEVRLGYVLAERVWGRGVATKTLVKRLDAEIAALRTDVAEAADEAAARRIVERLARCWAASLLVRHGHEAVGDAYVASRLGGDWGSLFGTLRPDASLASIARRAVPA